MLLERQEILDRLHAYVTESRRGSGRLVLVTGEAGIGKTSVVSAIAADLPRDTTLYWGACDAVNPPRPFAPLVDIAHRAPPDLSAALALADQDRVFNSFLSLIRSGPGRSRCIVIEDVHWADAATLDLLRVVGPRLRQTHAVVVATYREHEVGPLHPLRVALGDLPADSVAVIQVPSLSARAVSELARGSIIDPGVLYRVTGGNPFFVTEVVAAYGQGLPVTVRDAVLARVKRLSPEADRVLTAAAVLGPRAEAELVVSLAQLSDEAIDECVRSGMLRRDGDVVMFRHELARDAVLDVIPADHRRHLNLAAVNLLRRSETADPGRIARHAIDASDGPAILEFAPRAAQRAAALGAHREAVQYLDGALTHAAGLSAAQRAQMLGLYASSIAVVGELDRAVELQREALTLWVESGDVVGQSGCLVDLSFIEWLNGDGARASVTARDALALLSDVVPEGTPHARANAALAQRLVVSEADDVAALRYSSTALRIAEAAHDEKTAVHALTTMGVANIYLGNEQGWQELESALERARAAGLSEDVWRALINLVEAAMDLWRFDRADTYAREATAWMADRELPLYRALLSGRMAELALRRGRWDEAERLSTDLLSRLRTASQIRARALVLLGRLTALRSSGDPWPFLDEALSLVGDGELQDLQPIVTARIQAAWLLSDPDRMRAEASAATPWLELQANNWVGSELSFWRWKAGLVERASPETAEPFLIHMNGDHDAAAKRWASLGCPLYQALALADSDDPAALREALEIVQLLGAKSLEGRLTDRLVSMGATELPRGPRPSTRRNPHGLTDRELQILAFLGDGLRNAEIADRLVLSPKTVDHHVGAVLRKLHVADRQAAGVLARRMLIQDGEPSSPI
jgi:DNA-binding NarL/FixJ family response regulator